MLAGPHPRSRPLRAFTLRGGRRRYLMLAGPHPRSPPLRAFTLRGGRRRYLMLAGPHPRSPPLRAFALRGGRSRYFFIAVLQLFDELRQVPDDFIALGQNDARVPGERHVVKNG